MKSWGRYANPANDATGMVKHRDAYAANALFVFFVVQRRTSLVIISDAASPAPKDFANTRNGRSVTPAMGASTTFELSS